MRRSRSARIRSILTSFILAALTAGISAATVLADPTGGPFP
ncbi:MAG: hypothetical protein QOJ75_1028 [Chloroflexota bacterium]|nr:hypothetical protein [Chloroflexota bacterium]